MIGFLGHIHQHADYHEITGGQQVREYLPATNYSDSNGGPCVWHIKSSTVYSHGVHSSEYDSLGFGASLTIESRSSDTAAPDSGCDPVVLWNQGSIEGRGGAGMIGFTDENGGTRYSMGGGGGGSGNPNGVGGTTTANGGALGAPGSPGASPSGGAGGLGDSEAGATNPSPYISLPGNPGGNALSPAIVFNPPFSKLVVMNTGSIWGGGGGGGSGSNGPTDPDGYAGGDAGQVGTPNFLGDGDGDGGDAIAGTASATNPVVIFLHAAGGVTPLLRGDIT